MRHSAAPETLRAEHRQFAEDVEYYLSQMPRQLPSQYFYDELGSSLFEAICRLPWYPITRAERGLLATHGREVFAGVPGISTIVELGPGSGEKLVALLTSDTLKRPIRAHLVDVSASALEMASRNLAVVPELTIVTHQASYEAGLSASVSAGHGGGRTLALFLGSNIGNFDPPGADAFLRGIRAALAPGDALLLGTDLVKPESELLLAYDDPLQVTAAFNRNLLVRVNRELGADFDIDEFAHRALWNAEASRVEMHLVSQRRQRVRIAAAHVDVEFYPGETIWTESSYKYRPDDVESLLARADFRTLNRWTRKGFALTLAEAV